MVTSAELEELFTLGHETRSFEVKGPGDLTDKHYCAVVARAVLAMGNLRDGGLVCLGVDETNLPAMLPGLNADQISQWSDYDSVSGALAKYADPPVSFSLSRMLLSSGASVVLLTADEFDQIPHVCKKNYPDVLRDGMTYVRPRGTPRSVPVPSSSEMRELLDLAIDKGVREFVRRAGAAGVQLAANVTNEDLDEAAFHAEADAAWSQSSQVSAAIAKHGFSSIAVRPSGFSADLISPARLETFLSDTTVRLRGWPVPYIDQRIPVQRHGTWIGQDVEPRLVPHMEAWRLTTSGQFLHRRVLATDLRQSDDLAPTQANATGSVAVWDVLLYMVEVAEFGARMASTLGSEVLVFEVSLHGIAGRELVSGDWSRELHRPLLVSANQLSTSAAISQARLLGDTRQVGVDLTQALLEQFGLDVPDKLLMDWQERVFDGR